MNCFQGWIREEVPRNTQGGIGGGRKSDVYYISPSGKKFRSKPELLKALGDHYDLSAFDYFSGKMLTHHINANGKSSGKARTNGTSKQSQYDFQRSLRTDSSLVPPIRQTASIFKQPVTVRGNYRYLTTSFPNFFQYPGL